MVTGLIFLSIAIFCLMVWFVFMEYRNEWVYKQRVMIIENDSDEIEKYISYDEMMRRFCIWDVEKLKK